MNTTEKEKFESLWTDFIALVEGKLISTAAKQKLSTPLANLILSDAASSWSSDYEIAGKWLSNLKKLDSKKNELIKEVLLNDMHFVEIDIPNELPAFYNYILPAVGACAGCTISMYLGCGKIVQTASTLIPAILLYPAVNTFRKKTNELHKEKSINNYIQQLDKYKNSIISILS